MRGARGETIEPKPPIERGRIDGFITNRSDFEYLLSLRNICYRKRFLCRSRIYLPGIFLETQSDSHS